MNDLLVIAAQNMVVALVVGLCVYLVTRVSHNQPVAHLLWLLVLIKLVAPPIARVELAELQLPRSTSAAGALVADAAQVVKFKGETKARVVDRPTIPPNAHASAANASEQQLAAGVRLLWGDGLAVVLWVWLGVAALFGLITMIRIARFERLLRDTLPASGELRRLAVDIAGKLGIRRLPDVRYVECAEVPFLWCAGRRATIVLPMRLRAQLDNQRLALILAHELAHLRRRDHWVRAIELIVSTIYWWNPVVWFIRRQIHQTEDLCCDAWVRWTFPDCPTLYAELLLKTAESLGAPRVGARLLPATPFLRSLSLKTRIEMILENRFPPRVSTKALVVVALLALAVLPSFVQITKTEAHEGSKKGAQVTPIQNLESAAMPELPYAVRFEQGATRFLDGDKITIVEVRGTAETFAPRNVYRIKGSYTLASRDRAELATYTTAIDAENGQGATQEAQTTVVNRGHGTFTLFLPMSYRGFPHVSFYPADGGEGFGGNYFGTSNSVLKRWWGSKDKDGAAATSCDTTFLSKRFKYQVPFEIGRTQTKDGGQIEIREVWGTRPRIEVGGQYLVRGRYLLPHGERGRLYFFATAGGAWGQTASLDLQSTPVDEQEGDFELIHGMAGPGNFHLILTDAVRNSRWFSDVYFGTGDNVFR